MTFASHSFDIFCIAWSISQQPLPLPSAERVDIHVDVSVCAHTHKGRSHIFN